jgi:hypothetical protein
MHAAKMEALKARMLLVYENHNIIACEYTYLLMVMHFQQSSLLSLGLHVKTLTLAIQWSVSALIWMHLLCAIFLSFAMNKSS